MRVQDSGRRTSVAQCVYRARVTVIQAVVILASPPTGLFQFRMGTHKLPVNNSRHFNVPRADRHCTNCDKSVMGDEIHFLYECTKLNNLRAK